MVGLLDGVASREEVVEAPQLAEALARLHPRVAARVDVPGPLCGLHDGEVARDLREVETFLPMADVDSVESQFRSPYPMRFLTSDAPMRAPMARPAMLHVWLISPGRGRPQIPASA